MQFNTLLAVALAIIFCLLSLGSALPTSDDSLTALEDRGQFGYDYMLNCASSGKNPVSGAECWRRFRTTCDGNGKMVNPWKGSGNLCNAQSCTCVKRPGVTLPGFADPSPSEIEWAANMGSWKGRPVVDPKVSAAVIPGHIATTLATSTTAKSTPA